MNKTFAELGYNVGDTVRCVSSDMVSKHSYQWRDRFVLVDYQGQTTARSVNGGYYKGLRGTWELVSRKGDTQEHEYPTWGDMTPEQQGALLLAYHNGSTIELWFIDEWITLDEPTFNNRHKYRVKPVVEPEVVTHIIFGISKTGGGFTASRVPEEWSHSVSYDTIDGEPDCSSVSMVKL